MTTIGCASRYEELVVSAGLDAISIGDYPPDDVLARTFARVAEDPDPGRRGETLLCELLVPRLPGLRQELVSIEGMYDLVVLNDLLAGFAVPPIIDPRRLAVTLTTQPVGPFARMLRVSPCVKLVGSSPALLPPRHGLDASFVVTGFWLPEPPAVFRPDPVLETFLTLADGRSPEMHAPVVAVTLGSAWGTDPRMDARMLLRAGRTAGVRLVIQDFQAPLGMSTPSADGWSIKIGDVPYSWLFDRVDAVVHHGGAGTIAEVLRARRPSITVPHYGDHLYWAYRLQALGLSAGTVLPHELDDATLADRMTAAVNDSVLRRNVEAFGAQLGTRRAVGMAATTLESLARRTRVVH